MDVHVDTLIFIWSMCIVYFTVMNLSLQWISKALPNFLHELTTYGKLRRKAKSKWRLLSLKKKWFTIFYAWGLLWNSVMLYYFYCYVAEKNSTISLLVKPVLQLFYYPNTNPLPHPPCCCTSIHLQVFLGLLLVCIQTGRRLVECLFVTVFNNNSEIHSLHFVFGIFFYTALGPGVLKLVHQSAALDNSPGICSSTLSVTMVTPYQIIAIVLFFWSSWHQYSCHKILADVRTGSIDTSNKKQYAIPYGDWFEYVSSPHYLAEILIYIALCLCLGLSSVHCLLALATTLLNLLYTSRLNHEWCIKTFRHHPKRWALIPFVL